MDFLHAVNRFLRAKISNPDTSTGIIARNSREMNVQFITNSFPWPPHPRQSENSVGKPIDKPRNFC